MGTIVVFKSPVVGSDRRGEKASCELSHCSFLDHRLKHYCYFVGSSNSFIQPGFLNTPLAFDPSGGPTIPSFSIRSISRAARPYPTRSRRCSVEVEARPISHTTRTASW